MRESSGVWVDVCVLMIDKESESTLTVLVEADLVSALTEALTADVEAVLADDTALVGADTAIVGKENKWSRAKSVYSCDRVVFVDTKMNS